MFLLISYDLHSPTQNYSKLEAGIKSCGPAMRCLASTWVVKTGVPAQTIFEHLRPSIDSNDNIFVTRITDDRNGWMPKSVWDWLNANR